jgi:putative acetyltransferase
MIIRHEEPHDIAAIRQVNEQAFGGSGEANAIEALRDRGAATLSLVAEIEASHPATPWTRDDRMVGHLFFTPAAIETADHTWPALGLAPLAVLPEYQRQGIGSALMKAGLAECARLGYERVIVLGHPEYYPRFGFVRASVYGVRPEWEVPDEAFMVLELQHGALDGVSGLAKYQPEWNGV